MTYLIACGLHREAALIRRCLPGAVVIAGGGDGARLERELEAAILSPLPFRGGAGGGGVPLGAALGDGTPLPTPPLKERGVVIASIGIAGALDPALRPGDIVTDNVIGSDSIVGTVAEKAALRAATGGAAVDMETHIAARVAERHGLPFRVLRAISDSADEALPPAALVGMAPDGGLALGAVLWSLAQRPGQLPALLRLGRHTSLALANLERALRAMRDANLAE